MTLYQARSKRVEPKIDKFLFDFTTKQRAVFQLDLGRHVYVPAHLVFTTECIMHSAVKSALVATIATILATSAATAQSLDPGITCLKGNVPGADYADMDSNYKESIWDSKSAIRLYSDSTALELSVKDTYGNTVCESTADWKTRCKFRFNSDYSGTFSIRVDNLQTTSAGFKLCAE
jgi:hypothetical protein